MYRIDADSTGLKWALSVVTVRAMQTKSWTSQCTPPAFSRWSLGTSQFQLTALLQSLTSTLTARRPEAAARFHVDWSPIRPFWERYLLGLHPRLLARESSLNSFPNTKLADITDSLVMYFLSLKERKTLEFSFFCVKTVSASLKPKLFLIMSNIVIFLGDN